MLGSKGANQVVVLFQWLSKRGPLHHSWPQCPGVLPICEEEGLGGKLTCCPEPDNRTELKSYFKGPKGTRVGEGLLQMMSRIL